MHTSTAIENGTTPASPLDGIQYGKRLFPQVLDDAAAINPDNVIGMIAKSADISAGFRKVTSLQLSNAVNFTAWWIQAQIGRSEIFETLAYVGIQDFRYLIVEIAAVKCGYQVLLPGVRNSATNNEALFQSTKCSKLLFTAQFESKLDSFAASMPGLDIFQVPSFDDMVNCPAKHYPYTKTWEEAQNDPIIIVHTSGTTGTPKAVRYNHSFVAFAADGVRLLPPANGRHVTSLAAFEGLAYCSIPFFHLGGFLFGLSTLFSNYTVVFGPSEVPASSDVVNAIMQELEIGAMMLAPNVCESLVKDHGENFVTRSKALEIIIFLGGPLALFAGDFITTNTAVNVSQIYGSTETGVLSLLIAEPQHWNYFEWHPIYGPDLELVDPEAGLYEVVVNRRPDQAWCSGVFFNFPQLDQWRTKDLFRKHATEPHLWDFYGRRDDVIILSSGAKVNPLPFESVLQSHMGVDGAIVFGNSKLQCGLLIEPRTPQTKESNLLDELWLLVEKVNAEVQGHARIDKGMIMVIAHNKPFARSIKNTIVRSTTLEEHKKEIEEMYTTAYL